MMSGRIQRKVAIGAVATRPAFSAAVLTLSVMLAMVVTMLVGVSASFTQAVEDGAAASFGGYASQISGGGEESAKALRDMARRGEVVGVVSSAHGTATTEDRAGATIGTLMEVSGPSRYGRLVSGSYPKAKGEASLSVKAAEQIGVTVGGKVVLGGEDTGTGDEAYTVTGLTVNPADTAQVMIVAVSRSADLLDRAQTWLTDADTDGVKALHTDFLSGNASSSTLEAAKRDMRKEVSARELSAVPYFIVLVFVVGAVGISGTLLGLRSTLRAVVEALMACGQSRAKAWRTVQSGLFVIPVLGGALGVAVGYGLLWAVRPVLSSTLRQSWSGVPGLATLAACGLVLGYTALALIVTALVAGRRPRAKEIRPISRRAWPMAVVGGVGAVASIALVVTTLIHPVFRFGIPGGIVLAAISWPILLWNLPWLRRTPIQSRAVMATTRDVVPALNVIMLVLSISAFASTGLVMRIDNRSMPQGSYISAESINANDVAGLTAAFPDIMRKAYVFAYTEESAEQPRVMSVKGASCLGGFAGTGKGASACDEQTMDFMSNIGFVPKTGPGSDLAGLASTRAGAGRKVGVAFFAPATGQVERVDTTTIRGTDPFLDNDILPGLLLDPDSPETKRLGLTQSNMRVVYIPDFAAHPDKEKNAFRTALLTQAGYSFVTESDSAEFRQMRAIAATVPCFAALVCAITLVLLALAADAEQRSLRAALAIGGATRRQRLRLLRPILASATIATAVALALGWYASHPEAALWGTKLSGYYHYGWYWIIPLPVIVCTCVAITLVSAHADRAERRERDE